MENLTYRPFGTVDINDPFFDGLKGDYDGFENWYNGKAQAGEKAYVLVDDHGLLEGFMYLKDEIGTVDDVVPTLPYAKHLKVGTFKFDSHGTRRGERFIKKIFDHAIGKDVDDIYVTVFEKQEVLIGQFKKYGFEKVGIKETPTGIESVYVRRMKTFTGDILKDYPYINTEGVKKCILSIYPVFHSRMFPDSILNNESPDIIEDISHTNSIHKIFITNIRDVATLTPGDIVVMYRTGDGMGPAEYRSVATSICIVERYIHISEFQNKAQFMQYCKSYSIFSEQELSEIYDQGKYCHIIKFTYNAALPKRIIRKDLLEKVELPRNVYWGFVPLSDENFRSIFSLGEVNESFIINQA